MKGKISILQLLSILCLLSAFQASGQGNGQPAQEIPKPDHDTSFYRSYRGSIITRVFLSRNISQLSLDPPDGIQTMKYHANTPLNLGVGLTYKLLSVSISKGLNFLQSNTKKGKTNSFDFQAHLYKRRWTYDALAQFYKGYYLAQPNLGSPTGTGYYMRPDMGVQMVGITAYRVLNDRRFSYGAGLTQNALQEKSAGSFLIGGEAFYTAIHADSALAPFKVDSQYSKDDIRKVHLFEIGPGIGYAYTFVYKKHYFLLGSVNANLDAAFSREIGSGVGKGNVTLSPSYILRIGAGYNSNKWGLTIQWFTSSIHAQGDPSAYRYTMATGSYRLIYFRRIAINRKMKSILTE